MTSFEPLAERILHALRTAEPGSYGARTPAEHYDLDAARRMSPEERLDRLDEILRFAESASDVAVLPVPVRHTALRL